MPDSIQIVANPSPLLDTRCDAWLLPVCQDGVASANALAVDEALGGVLQDMRERGEFRGEAYQLAILPTLGRLPAARVVLVGLGKSAEVTPVIYTRAVAAACRTLGKKGLRDCALDSADSPFDSESTSRAAAEGAALSPFALDIYKSRERRESAVERLRVSGGTEKALEEGLVRGEANNRARRLVHEPGNLLTPPELARRAELWGQQAGLEVEVLDEEAMRRLGMEAILTVTRGAETEARFIVMRHRGGPSAQGNPDLALIGKAVTFDTGGISIKPVTDMGRMKGDMAGGAAVVAAMWAIGRLQLPTHVIGLIPAAVNMPDGRAWMPGDVITTMSGKTVETVTTDAEGRMLLADALYYAQSLQPARVVDIATLTGACSIALGAVASGLYGTDPELVDAVRTCGDACGERHWPMPLFKEYAELNRSEIADLKNSGGRSAGSVTAACFLREFAGSLPWAHLDIAGSGQYDKAKPWAPAGPTGTGVGTFINLARHFAPT